MPQIPDLITGTIYTGRGKVSNSTIIINSDIKTTTNSSGQYILDLANLQDGYVVGTAYSIVSYDEYDNEYTSSTITSTGTGQTANLYLEPRVKTNESRVSGILTPVSIRSVGDMPTSIENPIPVYSLERPFTKKMENNSSGQPTYIGEAPPGTPTSASKWRIRKMEYDDGATQPPTGETWANGNAEFDKVWDSRTGYTYS